MRRLNRWVTTRIQYEKGQEPRHLRATARSYMRAKFEHRLFDNCELGSWMEQGRLNRTCMRQLKGRA
jgi:hypothetical protein